MIMELLRNRETWEVVALIIPTVLFLIGVIYFTVLGIKKFVLEIKIRKEEKKNEDSNRRNKRDKRRAKVGK